MPALPYWVSMANSSLPQLLLHSEVHHWSPFRPPYLSSFLGSCFSHHQMNFLFPRQNASHSFISWILFSLFYAILLFGKFWILEYLTLFGIISFPTPCPQPNSWIHNLLKPRTLRAPYFFVRCGNHKMKTTNLVLFQSLGRVVESLSLFRKVGPVYSWAL